MFRNSARLRPITTLGKRWRLRIRARKKHAYQPLVLLLIKEAAMSSKVDCALTNFRMYYRRLHRAAAAFIHCRRARILALMKSWPREEMVSRCVLRHIHVYDVCWEGVHALDDTFEHSQSYVTALQHLV